MKRAEIWHFVLIAVFAGIIGNLAYDVFKHYWRKMKDET